MEIKIACLFVRLSFVVQRKTLFAFVRIKKTKGSLLLKSSNSPGKFFFFFVTLVTVDASDGSGVRENCGRRGVRENFVKRLINIIQTNEIIVLRQKTY